MPKGTQYTCPMHPRSCAPSSARAQMRHGAGNRWAYHRGRRPESRAHRLFAPLRVSAASIPLLVIAMGPCSACRSVTGSAKPPPSGRVGSRDASGPLGRATLLPQGLVARQPQPEHVDTDLIGAASPMSTASWYPVPDVFPHQFRGHGGAPPVSKRPPSSSRWSLSARCGLKARERTGSAIRALDSRPDRPAIAADGTRGDVPLDQLKTGDRLRVRPGRPSRTTPRSRGSLW